MPYCSQLAIRASICLFDRGSRIPRLRLAVGDPVVDGRQRQVGSPHAPSGQPQAVERLRAGHLVDQMQIDVEQGRLPGSLVGYMGVPNLLKKGARRVRHRIAENGTQADAASSTWPFVKGSASHHCQGLIRGLWRSHRGESRISCGSGTQRRGVPPASIRARKRTRDRLPLRGSLRMACQAVVLEIDHNVRE